MKTWIVDDVMSTAVVDAATDTPYRAVVDLLMSRGVSAVPVVDRFRRVSGVVSEADLLRKVEYADDDRPPRFFEGRRRRTEHAKATARTAGDLMTSPAITVLTGTSVPAAARLMDAENVKRLPVIDDLGRIVGIVSRGDLLKVHLRPDDDVNADVAEVLAVQQGPVSAQVAKGVVTLTGRLDRRSAADAVVRLTGQVPGVVDVVDQIDVEYDDTAAYGAGIPFGIA